jgi:hypothetical protein
MYFPFTTARSRKFNDAARMRTSTWSAAGAGVSRSARFKPLIPVLPFVMTWIFTAVPPFLDSVDTNTNSGKDACERARSPRAMAEELAAVHARRAILTRTGSDGQLFDVAETKHSRPHFQANQHIRDAAGDDFTTKDFRATGGHNAGYAGIEG